MDLTHPGNGGDQLLPAHHRLHLLQRLLLAADVYKRQHQHQCRQGQQHALDKDPLAVVVLGLLRDVGLVLLGRLILPRVCLLYTSYTDIRQLTPEIANALIRRIEVHSKDKKTKKVKGNIYFTAVGLYTLPTGKEMLSAMEDIRQNPQQFKTSA